MIMRIRIVTFLSLWLATIVFGCDVPERPKVVKVSNASAFRPVHPNEVEDIQSAMRAIITLCRDDLGLPVVDPLFLHLYKNTASFWFFGIGRRTLFDREEFAAISHENTIHINLEKTGNRLWGPSLPLLAHEYAHNVNYALAGNTIKGPIWFAEGFAEWVAAKVIDGLGWQSYAITLNRSTRELAHYRDFIDGLYRLQDKQDWDTALHKPNGSIRTYGLAFVTVDRLIAKKGLSSVVQYIKSGDFQSSFSDLQVNYKIVPHELSSGLEESKFSINRPEWKIGHYWIYQQRIFGTTLTVRKEIIREDSVQGLPVFVIKAGNDEELYAAESLGILATKNKGEFAIQRNKPNESFSWPLEQGKVWSNRFTARDLAKKRSFRIDRLMEASNLEYVTVPAGTFKTVRIEVWDNESGRLEAEYWYSPTSKWFVRSLIYDVANGFAQEQVLLSFKVD